MLKHLAFTQHCSIREPHHSLFPDLPMSDKKAQVHCSVGPAGSSNDANPNLYGILIPGSSSYHRQSQVSSLCSLKPFFFILNYSGHSVLVYIGFKYISNHSWTCLRAFPALPRKPHYVSNKLFTLSWYLCHQSWHPNQILGEGSILSLWTYHSNWPCEQDIKVLSTTTGPLACLALAS